VKEWIKDQLREYKSEVPALWQRGPSWKSSLGVLKRYGLSPVTIFDIGVAQGTYQLYRAFPHASYHLIEPAHRALAHMQRLAKRRLLARVHPVALGDKDGEATFEERPDLQGSTFLDGFDGSDPQSKRYTVQVRRFDSLFKSPFERPALVKIDVQGFERAVLQGMNGCMGWIDAIIVEVSTIATLKGAPEAFEIMTLMQSSGFVLADVVGMLRRPIDDATAQLDLMFVPLDSPIRRERRW
jgi:FkbM family methyltransferase